MEYDEFLDDYIFPYDNIEYIYNPQKGFIVWRLGTGQNYELLHIKTFEKKKGYGKELVLGMLDRLRENPPYYSVFGFTRVNNYEAHAFYKALGFRIENVTGLYKHGECRLFWAPFNELINKHGE